MGKFKFIDLFCGIGGFHQAMTALDGECVFACDIDVNCRKTYKMNYGIEPHGDIKAIDAADLPDHDVLCAGFPCQAFSKAGNRRGFEDATKGTLFFDVCRILGYHRPRYALLENVRNLASHDGGNTWRVIHESLTRLGYNVPADPVIFSPHYLGIPQHRERVYIMCVRADVGYVRPFAMPDAGVECNIDSVLQPDAEIADIDRYRLSADEERLIELWDVFIRNIRCDRLPGFPVWSDRLCNLDPDENLDNYPRWKRNFILKNHELYATNRDFIDSWLVEARRSPLFFGARAKLEWQAGQTPYPSLWNNIMQFRPSGIRVKPGSYFPALVAITQTSIVGSRRRYLTPRECARLQSFPDSFRPDTIESQAYKQLGNAVNVEVLKLFARHMLES